MPVPVTATSMAPRVTLARRKLWPWVVARMRCLSEIPLQTTIPMTRIKIIQSLRRPENIFLIVCIITPHQFIRMSVGLSTLWGANPHPLVYSSICYRSLNLRGHTLPGCMHLAVLVSGLVKKCVDNSGDKYQILWIKLDSLSAGLPQALLLL